MIVINFISNKTDSLKKETTGAGYENSAQNITKSTRYSFKRYKIKDIHEMEGK